jgi:membrane protein DedA with SNARE-associated domain
MISRVITIIGFTCVVGLLFTLEYLGRRRTNRIPTVGEWLGFIMRWPVGRVLILLGWLWLGWHYFAR